MRHSHLDMGDTDWSIAIVESVLERGPDSEIIALLKAVRKNPYGPAAEAVLRSIPHLRVYGYPKMFKIAIAAWRAQTDEGLGKGS
jgi:hypothetical protein